MESNYLIVKRKRKEEKKKNRRGATADEVIFIFEKVLEGWKTIKIYNTIIQKNKESEVSKKNVEDISTGNSKIFLEELDEKKYKYYEELREKVYKYHKDRKEIKRSNLEKDNKNEQKTLV